MNWAKISDLKESINLEVGEINVSSKYDSLLYCIQ